MHSRQLQKGVYYIKNEESEKILINIFSELAGNEKGKEEIIQLKGRQIISPMAANKVAFFTFNQLCGEALGLRFFIFLTCPTKVFILFFK